jgi:hypothetical protein
LFVHMRASIFPCICIPAFSFLYCFFRYSCAFVFLFLVSFILYLHFLYIVQFTQIFSSCFKGTKYCRLFCVMMKCELVI